MFNITWVLEFSKKADKQFAQLDSKVQQRILDYFEKNVLKVRDPRSFAKPVEEEFKGYWRFRVQDYWIICELHDYKMVITAVKVGDRIDIYD